MEQRIVCPNPTWASNRSRVKDTQSEAIPLAIASGSVALATHDFSLAYAWLIT